MSFNKNSVKYENYLKNVKLRKIKIFITQIVLLIAFFVLWEVLADKNIINTFLFSKPSDIYSLFISYTSNGTLIKHVWVSVYETLIGLFIGSTLGIIIAIMLWWSETLAKILDPFLVVLNKLEKLGYIRRDPTKPRAIEILSNIKDDALGLNQEIIPIPLVGQITAGDPILANENIEEYFPLPANLVKGNDNFILRVKGESMIGAGILDKDYVIVDRSNYAVNSDIVVALINGEYATVKRFFKEDRLVRLQPENEFMDSIVLDERNIEVIGVVRGVFRTL